MSKRVTIDELKSYLWNSAVLLRTHIDAGSYKQYIFPLLFFKRLCDVYDEEYQIALEESEGDVDYANFAENHRFVIPTGYHWTNIRETSDNVGEAIAKAFHEIERANREKLIGVFGDAVWTNKNRLTDSLLKDLIEHFSSITLSLRNCPEDELGVGYEYLIKQFADDSGHTAQEFYTNRTVVHLMTEILQPQSEESIYDPTCGSAGMLISAVAYLKAHNKEWRNLKIYGQELNYLTSAIGKMNLFLHGIKDFKIVNDDTIVNPAFIENGNLKQFDLVLANPPYSIKQWNRAAFTNDKFGRNTFGIPPQSRADFVFIQHIISSMAPITGRSATLLPHGVLNRDEESDIRSKIVAADLIEAVIGLGRNLFYNSGLESCIIICRSKKSASRKGKILFIDAEACQHKERNQAFLYESDIAKIVSAYRSENEVSAFSKFVTNQQILDKNGNLNIKSYVNNNIDHSDEKAFHIYLENYLINSNKLKDTPILSGSGNVTKLGELKASGKLPAIKRSSSRQMKLGDIAEEYSIRVNDPSNSEFNWYIGSDCIDGYSLRIDRKSSTKMIKSTQKAFKTGDYLLVRRSLYGSDFRERAPRADFDGVCSADILTIRESSPLIAGGFLPFILFSKGLWDFIVSNSTGSLTRRIKWDVLKYYEFNLPDLAEQEYFSKALWASENVKRAYEKVKKSFSSLLSSKIDSIITGGTIDFSKELPELPINWRWVTLSEISSVISKGTTPSQEEGYEVDGINYLRGENILEDSSIDKKGLKHISEDTHFITLKRSILEEGDVLITIAGKIGFVSVVEASLLPCNTNQAIAFIRIKKELAESQYIKCALRSHFIQKKLLKEITRTAIPNLTLKNISECQIPLPPLEQQKKICAEIQNLQKYLSLVEYSLESINDIQRFLLKGQTE